MNKEELIKSITEIDHDCKGHFDILKNVSTIVNNEDNDLLSRELVLRVLDNRDAFSDYSDVVNSLVRQVGLMPYADEDALGFKDSLAFEFFRPLSGDEDIVFHRAQADVYHKLLNGESVILSAPTSFGKSKIVDSIISLDRYENIAVVVPTIALIDETRRRLSRFSGTYKIVTQVTQVPDKRNIFIFTAERLIAYEDSLPQINFFVIDEFYKIGALERDEERTVALNQAFYKLHKMGGQFYLLGPNIQKIPSNLDRDLKCGFYNTSFSTVVSEIEFIDSDDNELETLKELLLKVDDQTLVYCKSPNRVNEVAHMMLESELDCVDDSDVAEIAQWIGAEFHHRWIFPLALKYGIALHHGRLPRSLAQLSVKLFNERKIKYLICTSTLIEGVNTSAKNIVIFDHKIGTRKYDFFTFNNIKGRGGRMFEHFIGNVYIFNHPPQEELPFVDFPFYSQGEEVPEGLLIQLDETDLKDESKSRLNEYFDERVLPIGLIKKNSAVNPSDQVDLANAISAMPQSEASNLLWNAYPSYEQLELACELIWKHFISKGKAGVFTPKQLAFKLNSLAHNNDLKSRVADALKPGQYAARDPDEAVERILDFDRNWANFTFPKLLMALDSIQRYILEPQLGRAGDYSFYAANIESLFRKPSLVALEEFGLPIQIGEKIDGDINISEDIDTATAQVLNYTPHPNTFSNFERNVIVDVQKHL